MPGFAVHRDAVCHLSEPGRAGFFEPVVTQDLGHVRNFTDRAGVLAEQQHVGKRSDPERQPCAPEVRASDYRTDVLLAADLPVRDRVAGREPVGDERDHIAGLEFGVRNDRRDFPREQHTTTERDDLLPADPFGVVRVLDITSCAVIERAIPAPHGRDAEIRENVTVVAYRLDRESFLFLVPSIRHSVAYHALG